MRDSLGFFRSFALGTFAESGSLHPSLPLCPPMPPRQISVEEMCSLSPVRSLSAVFATLGRAPPAMIYGTRSLPPSLAKTPDLSRQEASELLLLHAKGRRRGKEISFLGSLKDGNAKGNQKVSTFRFASRENGQKRQKSKGFFSGLCRMSECRLLANRSGGGEGSFVSSGLL